jgi:glycosyltransferase involved in cell wall biosynthesis
MNHDVIDDRYGRLFELPDCLSAETQVRGFCLDYRLSAPRSVDPSLAGNWSRANIPRTLLIGWFFSLVQAARRFRPDFVVASSDCLHVILGSFIAWLVGARFLADLYDDYATFGLANIPGTRWLYRRALARAQGISVVSRTLGRDTQAQYPGIPVVVLESTIDAQRFQPRDQSESRKMFGLEALHGKKLVGVCGGLNAFHGADVVFRAIEIMARRDPEVTFVVAGKLYDEWPLPALDNVRYLGMLPHEQMSWFFSALDVAIVALSNSKFGYYAFPQKAYEVLACRVPVVAADVGALSLLFETLPGALYNADSTESLADKLQYQIAEGAILEVDIPTWGDQARRLNTFLREDTLA